MKCERCESRATIHIIDIASHGVRDFHLCPKCAKEAGYNLMPEDISFEQVLQRLINDSSELLDRGDDSPFGNLREKCEVCGTSRGELIKDGVIGCEEDVSLFREEMREVLKDFHGNSQHVGKQNTEDGELARKQRSLTILERRLEEAVKAENFELAARFRDEIKELK